MPDLNFQIDQVQPQLFATAPTLNFKLKIAQSIQPATAIHTIALRCQVRIEAARRHYSPGEQERLLEVFGRPEQWHQSLHSMLWTHVSTMVPGFEQSIETDLPVPCTTDFNVGAGRYFTALDDGLIPLSFLFNGTIFYQDDNGALQITPIPWDKEASFKMPVSAWKQMLDHYYPNAAWLTLNLDVVERLRQYRLQQHLATWDQAIDNLLNAAAMEVSP